jgi:hypothetical protein
MSQETKQYKTIAVSCKAKELLDEIARIAAVNRGAFVEKLIEREYKKLKEEK